MPDTYIHGKRCKQRYLYLLLIFLDMLSMVHVLSNN